MPSVPLLLRRRFARVLRAVASFSFVSLYCFRSMRAVLSGANPAGRQSGVAGQGQHTPSGLPVVFSYHICRRVYGRGWADKNAEKLAGVDRETADSAGRRRTGEHTQKGAGSQRLVCGRVAAALQGAVEPESIRRKEQGVSALFAAEWPLHGKRRAEQRLSFNVAFCAKSKRPSNTALQLCLRTFSILIKITCRRKNNCDKIN